MRASACSARSAEGRPRSRRGVICISCRLCSGVVLLLWAACNGVGRESAGAALGAAPHGSSMTLSNPQTEVRSTRCRRNNTDNIDNITALMIWPLGVRLALEFKVEGLGFRLRVEQ